MPSHSHDERELDRTASWAFTRLYAIAIAVAALIGLAIGVVWVIAGLLNFHPLW